MCASGLCKSAECGHTTGCSNFKGAECLVHPHLSNAFYCQKMCNSTNIYSSDCGVHQLCMKQLGRTFATCVTPRCHDGAQVLKKSLMYDTTEK